MYRHWIEPPVIAITWYRGNRNDKISLFRRILTVTNLMCLARNKPDIDNRPTVRSRDNGKKW